MMTLEEYIEHYNELHKKFKKLADKSTGESESMKRRMSDGFKQMAEWLEELKRYRENDDKYKENNNEKV